jgi:hypothetical protein
VWRKKKRKERKATQKPRENPSELYLFKKQQFHMWSVPILNATRMPRLNQEQRDQAIERLNAGQWSLLVYNRLCNIKTGVIRSSGIWSSQMNDAFPVQKIEQRSRLNVSLFCAQWVQLRWEVIIEWIWSELQTWTCHLSELWHNQR